MKPWLVAAGLLLLVVAGFSVARRATAPSPSPAMSAAAVVPELASTMVAPGLVAAEDGDPSLGSADAPRTLFLFAQWHCADCRHFFEATLPLLQHNLIDTGRLRLVFKAFPVGEEGQDTEDAQRIAEAAYCAEAQHKFWEYSDRLSAAGARYDTSDLVEYAVALGLNRSAFVACTENKEYAEVMARTIRTALAAGITTTPAFVLQDRLYEGALSYGELEPLLR